MLATIALVGRPNVGKSTLFNRLLRSNKAITHDQPGVTRDRMYGVSRRSAGRPFALVDTGGLVPGGKKDFELEIMDQASEAIAEAQAVFLVVDAREGLMPVDEQAAQNLREAGKPTLLVVNKVDGYEKEELSGEFHSLGLDVVCVSAAHGYGISALLKETESFLEKHAVFSDEEESETDQGLTLALLGRPNAGKSSLINALTGRERLIVSEVAGTTRDSVDVSFEKHGKKYTFVDTAGIRRRTKITESLEQFSVLKSLKAVYKAQVTILVLDGTQPLSHQDKRLIALLDREKALCIILVNKVDLISADKHRELKKHFTQELRIVKHIPVLYVSACAKTGLKKVLPLATQLYTESSKRIGTGLLNRILQQSLITHQPPLVKRRRAKFYYMTQADVQPPTFVFFVNDKNLIKPAYTKYLENQIRKLAELPHAPVLIRFKSSHGQNKK